MTGGGFINDMKKIPEKIIVECISCSSKFFMGKFFFFLKLKTNFYGEIERGRNVKICIRNLTLIFFNLTFVLETKEN